MAVENLTPEQLKTAVEANNGKPVQEGAQSSRYHKQVIAQELERAVKHLSALRDGSTDRNPVDIDIHQYAKERFGYGLDDDGVNRNFFNALGIDLERESVASLSNFTEFGNEFRWLVPELIRSAIVTGLRKDPIYPNLIADEVSVSQREVTMPHIHLSGGNPKYTNEGETIQTGETRFGQRSVKIHKITQGIQVTDEVINYVSLNILSRFLGDVGVRINNKMNTLAIDTLINGDDSAADMSAFTIGVDDYIGGSGSPKGLQRRDLLRAWLRMGRIGRQPAALLQNENMFIHIMELPEFKGFAGETTKENMVLRTPLPNTQDMWAHASVISDDHTILIDPSAAMIKLNAQALQVETERIASRQISGSYVSVTSGFANLFRDARLIVDQSQEFTGFPAAMDPAQEENDPLGY